MDNERNQHQIIRKDARNCFVESLSDAFAFGKVHLGFATCIITSQRAYVQRYLLSQGISPEDFEEIVDDGYSGTNMNRPGIARLLQIARRPAIFCSARNAAGAGNFCGSWNIPCTATRS